MPNIDELKKLHKMAFGDSDEYIDFFFKNRYIPQFSYVEESNNKIISVAYTRFINLFINSKDIKIPFLNGIATHPNFRYQGYSKKVINQALSHLEVHGFPFVLLHPFEHSFYENLGFTTISYVDKKTISNTPPTLIFPKDSFLKLNNDNYTVSQINFDSLDDINIIYETKAKQYLAYNNRTLKEWENILIEHLSDNGFGYLIYKNMIPISYILIYSNNTVRELVTLDYNILNHIDFLNNKIFIDFSSQSYKYTMGKILSISKSLYYLPFNDIISGYFNIECEGELFSIKVKKGHVLSVQPIVNLNDYQLLSFTKSSLLKTIFGLLKLTNLETSKANIFKEFSLFLFDTY